MGDNLVTRTFQIANENMVVLLASDSIRATDPAFGLSDADGREVKKPTRGGRPCRAGGKRQNANRR